MESPGVPGKATPECRSPAADNQTSRRSLSTRYRRVLERLDAGVVPFRLMSIRSLRLVSLSACLLAACTSVSVAAELRVNLRNAPDRGRLVFQVFDSPNSFGDFRDPVREVAIPADGDRVYSIDDVPAGEIALLVYVDENDNGLLDKNFIGIPTETVGLSNNYRPKGPPSFVRASFTLRPTASQTVDIELYRILGERGTIGVGLGVIGRSSPYSGSSEEVLQTIPAVTYNGERLQWLGPRVSYGVVGGGRLRLALTAVYRVGTYEENDSPLLLGLGDRDGTLLAGLGVQAELPGGVDLELDYRHDVLDRIGGGAGTIEVSRGFQFGLVRFQPRIAATWSSRELASHDFGVPEPAAGPDRPAYELDAIWSYETGFTSFLEITERWRLLIELASEWLPSEVTASPIVEDDRVLKGFAAIVYVF
jgi:outer membrane protein